MTYPLRLESSLTRSAEQVASRMSRSVPEQIAHWARIGRELERSPDVSLASIRNVLDGAAEYDALSPREQAIVRAAWIERMSALRADLRLDRPAGKGVFRYAELDDRGRVTVREPKPRYAARKKAGKRRRA